MTDDMTLETKEVFLPDKVLKWCLDDWESAEDEQLAKAVGEGMEHAYWHWRWVMAIRAHKCRLVVVQARDVGGKNLNPHYQLGDLLTLSGWHPARAIEEARTLLNEAGDGLTFDLPVDGDMMDEWGGIAKEFELDDESWLEVLATAMVLMDDAHDQYVQELGDDFYIATRGLERDLHILSHEEAGQWSNATVRVVDKTATVNDVHIYMKSAPDSKKAVPIAYPPDEAALKEMEEPDE